MDDRLISITEAAEILGVSVNTLRRWDTSGKLKSTKSEGGHRLYDREVLQLMARDIEAIGRVWADSISPPVLTDDVYCDSQDRFRARQHTLTLLLDRNLTTHAFAPIIGAVVGEIGNNSFDHNIGNWPDTPGIYFAYDLTKRLIVLADRGQGILATLSRVKPEIRDDMEALTIAMTERVSGRAPEQRGNGLKFVAKVALEQGLIITLQSGIACADMHPKQIGVHVRLANRNIRGTITSIHY